MARHVSFLLVMLLHLLASGCSSSPTPPGGIDAAVPRIDAGRPDTPPISMDGGPPPPCTGTATPCHELSTATCEDVPGCSVEFCVGTSWGCSGASRSACSSIPGCFLSGSDCIGSAPSCDEAGDIGLCRDLGCSWNSPAVCTGPRTECRMLSESSCESRPGCSLTVPRDAGPPDAPPDAPDAPFDGGCTSGCLEVVDLSLTGGSTCALLSDGHVRCWGFNNPVDRHLGMAGGPRPEDIGIVSNVTAFALGDLHGCALSAGELVCWGRDQDGQCGQGTVAPQRLTPVPVVGLSGVTAVAAGGESTCAIVPPGEVWCFGSDNDGVGPMGGSLANPTPLRWGTFSDGVAVALEDGISLALRGSGAVHYASAGVTTPGTATIPEYAGATAITAGDRFSCALLDRAVWCRGVNGSGQLGDGTTTTRATAVAVPLPGDAVDVAAGGEFACAVVDGDGVHCWGRGDNGECGPSVTVRTLVPVRIPNTTGALSITLGHNHACAHFGGMDVRCWGRGETGAIGDGSMVNRSSAVSVAW